MIHSFSINWPLLSSLQVCLISTSLLSGYLDKFMWFNPVRYTPGYAAMCVIPRRWSFKKENPAHKYDESS